MSREKFTHAESGCGQLGSVITSQMSLNVDLPGIVADLQELRTLLDSMWTCRQGQIAATAVCCSVLNRRVGSSHYLFYVKDDGEIGIDVLTNDRTRALAVVALAVAE